MRSNPRGLALIINNTNFPGHPEKQRKGADEDTDYMLKLFRSMGYVCDPRLNVFKNVSKN
jgi:hypothetical protein